MVPAIPRLKRGCLAPESLSWQFSIDHTRFTRSTKPLFARLKKSSQAVLPFMTSSRQARSRDHANKSCFSSLAAISWDSPGLELRGLFQLFLLVWGTVVRACHQASVVHMAILLVDNKMEYRARAVNASRGHSLSRFVQGLSSKPKRWPPNCHFEVFCLAVSGRFAHRP